MQKGFKKVVLDLIREKPGLTAEEYARMALDQRLCGSDSKDPVFSLKTTLMKECREGRMPTIKAIKVNGKFHYFPADQALSNQSTQQKKDIAVTVILPPDVIDIVDMLVELGKAKSRGEALGWLVREGIKAKKHDLDQAKEIFQEIKRLKQSISI